MLRVAECIVDVIQQADDMKIAVVVAAVVVVVVECDYFDYEFE